MRWYVLLGLVVLPVGGLSVLYRWPPQVPATAITIAALALGMFQPRMSDDAKVIWFMCACVLGIAVIYGSFRSEAKHKQELGDSERHAEELFAKQREGFDRRFDEQQKRSDETVALLGTAQATMAELVKANAGASTHGLKRNTLNLAARIVGFLVDRRKNEPPQEIAMMGLPIPVGKYAEYIFETGELYREQFDDEVRQTIEDLKRDGLEDKELEILAGPHVNPHDEVVRKIAEHLRDLAKKLKG